MKNLSWKTLRFPLAISVLFLLCSCDLFDSVSTLFVSEQDEMQLGAEFDTQLRTDDSAKKEFPLFIPKNHADTILQNYVTHLADTILGAIPAADKPGYSFKFTLIDADVINAFAVPGGYVYIYTGIIKRMRNESELACVLGHEMTHVTHHHYRDAMVKDQALGALVHALLGNDSTGVASYVAQNLFQLAALKVSRENESDADAYGVRNAARIGRNPMGVATFFQRMNDESKLAAVFSTHPASATRVEDVTAEVNGDPTLQALAQDSLNTNYTQHFLDNTTALPKVP